MLSQVFITLSALGLLAAPPPAQAGSGPGSKGKDEFQAKCIPFPCNDWNTELDAAYKAPVSGSGDAGSGMFESQNAAVLEWNEAGGRKTQKKERRDRVSAGK